MKNLRVLSILCLALAAGCASDEAPEAVSPGGSKAVIQSGPQDIGEFRAIVDQGMIPALSVLDEQGFFAEHKIDLPPADCGTSLCVHPMLAVAPRFDGGNWSMAFIGMNTSVDTSALATRPRHLVLVLDDIVEPRDGMLELIHQSLRGSLTENDRVSLITYFDQVRILTQDSPVSALADLSLPPDSGEPNPPLYAALSEALTVVGNVALEGFEQRLLVFGADLSFGESTDSTSFYEDLAHEFAARDIAISVFTSTPGQVSYVLSEAGGGNYYFVSGAEDFSNALDVEGETAFVPIARNLKLTLEAAPGYQVGRLFGAPRSTSSATTAVLESPVSYVGARSSSDDVDTGRRGGGGGWFVQLLAEPPPPGSPFEEAEAFTLNVEYDDAVSGEHVAYETTLTTPLGVGQNPEPQSPYFSDPERGKPFMMVNMYLSLATTTMLANENQCGAALAIEPMMTLAWEIFTELFPDPDIDADFELLKALSRNIEATCQEPIPQTVEVPMSCGYL